MNTFKSLSVDVKQYLLITANYWAFTLTDGALRMLVVLYFHQLGYAPLAIAMLFIFYEVFGVITNLVGGWLGARVGLNKTMQVGLVMQVGALTMLAVPNDMLTMVWVMLAQALSGIAKDLNKMSAKSSIKTLVPKEQQGQLFKWVAVLTGSKNTLKGVGFFLGGILLHRFGFQHAVLIMAAGLALTALLSFIFLKKDVGKAKTKPKFNELFSKSASLNYLSAARLFLFSARDIWFVIAVPVFLAAELGWSHQSVGTFMAGWIIAYGIVQASTPKVIRVHGQQSIKYATHWAGYLGVTTFITAALLIAFDFWTKNTELVIVAGLLVFGLIFAVNSALHSYIIVAIAKEDGISMDVGFYYMANALGRLLGTVLSGAIFQSFGIVACLIGATILAFLSGVFIRYVRV